LEAGSIVKKLIVFDLDGTLAERFPPFLATITAEKSCVPTAG
jgi:hypothetical protein